MANDRYFYVRPLYTWPTVWLSPDWHLFSASPDWHFFSAWPPDWHFFST